MDIVNREEGVDPRRDRADMVLFNCFGDERWYIAYRSPNIPLSDGWIVVTIYSGEDCRPRSYCVSPEHQTTRIKEADEMNAVKIS